MPVYKVPPGSIKAFNGYNATTTIAITPNDSNKIVVDAGNPKGYDMAMIQVITAGNLAVVDSEGNQRTYTAAPLGFIVPFPVIQVRATGTTAVVIGLIPKF